MRRTLSVATSLLIVLSVTACAAGTNTRNNRQGGQNIGYNQGTNRGTGNNLTGGGTTGMGTTGRGTGTTGGTTGRGTGTTGGTGVGTGTGTSLGTYQYADGVYTGEGNRGAYGNERATVTIRGGRITDISLTRVDAQGRSLSTGTGTGMTGGTTGTTGTTGRPAGGVTGGTAGPAASLDTLRNTLRTMMINIQTYNVTVPTTATMTSTDRQIAENWKLAVRRALDQARRS